MGVKYFISDMHFGHSNIINLNKRPFKDVYEMNKYMIDAWNTKVTNDDEVYILGDVAYKAQTDIVSILNTLHGTKYLITGNHDRKNLKNPAFRKCFAEISDIKTLNMDGKYIVMCHFPLGEWDGYYRGAYHIYGHIHNNTSVRIYNYLKEEERALNAGVDIINFAPATFEELLYYNKVFKSMN